MLIKNKNKKRRDLRIIMVRIMKLLMLMLIKTVMMSKCYNRMLPKSKV